MATLAELRTKANTQLADFWSRLKEKEEAYFQKNGRYFQLLVTPESHVVDGVDSDFATRLPSDERKVVDVDFAWTKKVPFSISVDTFQNEEAQGYVANVHIQLQSGGIYQRSRTLIDKRKEVAEEDEKGNSTGVKLLEGEVTETSTNWAKLDAESTRVATVAPSKEKIVDTTKPVYAPSRAEQGLVDFVDF